MIPGLVLLVGLLSALALGSLCVWINPASLPNYLMASVNIFLALFAYYAEPKRAVNRAFAAFALMVAAWGADLTFLFIAPTREMAETGLRFARLGLIFLFPSVVYFAQVFTRRDRPLWPLVGSLLLASLLAVASVFGLMDDGVRHNGVNWYPIPNHWYHLYTVLVLGSFTYATGLAWAAWRAEPLPRLRLQYRQLFFGLFLMLVPGYWNQFATYAAWQGWSLGPLTKYLFLGSLGGVMFFMVIAYSIVRNRWLDISFIVRRALLYSTMTAAIAGVYGALLVGFNLVLGIESSSAAASLVTLVVVAFAVMPLRDRLQNLIDRMFHRDDYDDRQMLQSLTETVGSVIGLRRIAETVLDAILPAMRITKARIALSGSLFEKSFGRSVEETTLPPPPIPPAPVDRTEPEGAPAALLAHMSEGGLELAFPIRSKDAAEGVLLIGPKLSDLPYRREELQLLRTVARQTGAAAENSRLYEQVLAMKLTNDNILRSMDDGLVTLDAEARVSSINPAARRTLGDEPLAAVPALAEIARTTLSTGSGADHVEIPFGERTLMVTSTPLRAQDGSLTGGLLLFADITGKKEMERRLERDRRLALIGQLASQIAHEIRNPIASMKVLIDAVPHKKNDPVFEKFFMNTVPAEIDRLNRLVEDLLDYSRPPKLIRIDTNLVEVLETSLKLVSEELRGIEVRREFASPPPMVRADGEKLKQVFINLIKNAAEAMRDSARKELSLRVYNNGQVRVEVADTGSGIEPIQLEKIFTPFHTTKAAGTGLGLATVHRIVEDHGWRIDVESEPGRGTRFIITAS
jgi:signal transduction histidine kinase